MRWRRVSGLAMALLIAAAPVRALGPADGPGCIGVKLEDCLRWLRATLQVEEGSLPELMAHRHDTDVNGRPLSGGLLPIRARLPGEYDVFVILLNLRLDDTVKTAESNVLLSLLRARTAAIYDQSKFYDIVWRLLGRRCPAISKLELYRFFENSVKPRVKEERRDFASGLYALHRLHAHAEAVPYCGGVSLGYTNLLEWRGTKELDAAANPSEFASIELK
jgi:hypothetical protein